MAHSRYFRDSLGQLDNLIPYPMRVLADNGENTHALEIRRDGSTAGNDFKIHLVIFGDNGTQHLESAYLTEGTY